MIRCLKSAKSRTFLDKNFIFEQDGAPPYFHRNVTTFLDETFPGRWVGRGGPTAWPPRSPDLTPLDFFTLGLLRMLGTAEIYIVYIYISIYIY
jgi:hypothetical protein